jgi:hypothetical protein
MARRVAGFIPALLGRRVAPLSPRAVDLHLTGWGYRHIAAGHGWSLDDDAATREALIDGRVRPSQNADASDGWVFIGPPYPGTGGVICRRDVIVDFGTKAGEPGPKGIITSFARSINVA